MANCPIYSNLELAQQAYQKEPTPKNLKKVEEEFLLEIKNKIYTIITKQLEKSRYSTIEDRGYDTILIKLKETNGITDINILTNWLEEYGDKFNWTVSKIEINYDFIKAKFEINLNEKKSFWSKLLRK